MNHQLLAWSDGEPYSICGKKIERGIGAADGEPCPACAAIQKHCLDAMRSDAS